MIDEICISSKTTAQMGDPLWNDPFVKQISVGILSYKASKM
jgi:hypothetical protein